MYQVYAERALRLIEGKLSGACSLSMLCRELGVIVKRVEGSALSKGYVTLLHGTAYILLHSNQTLQEKRVTLAHELAHLLLGHVGDWYGIIGRDLPQEEQEREADRLATLILGKFYD